MGSLLSSGFRLASSLLLRLVQPARLVVDGDLVLEDFLNDHLEVRHAATIDERAVTLAGEGIELPIATDHDHLTTDLADAAGRMGVASEFTPVVGDEVTTRIGHFNAFPDPVTRFTTPFGTPASMRALICS